MILLLLAFSIILQRGYALTSIAKFGMESQVGRQMIFTVESKLTCLYEPLEAGMFLKVKAQPYPLIKSRFPIQSRLTSPSGEFSEWFEGEGTVSIRHNVTETGDYEICLMTSRPYQILFDLFFQNPETAEKGLTDYVEHQKLDQSIEKTVRRLFALFYNIVHSIKYYNMISFADEKLQLRNQNMVEMHSLLYSLIFIVVAIVNVVIIRKMFRLDPHRIRI
ncbi:unnamed protein product [Auanema sp. JU1783]|nr:unnamed protein product [Auanema sp. JU1783]